RSRVQARFETDSANLADDIRDRLPVYGMALRAGAEFVEHGGPQALRVAYQDHWADAVAGLKLTDFAPGFRDLGFAEQRPDGKAVVTLAAPMERANMALIGFNLAADAARRQAMVTARDTGDPVLLPIANLAALAGDEAAPGLLLFMPVFPEAMVSADQEVRRRRVLGYTFLRFHLADLLRGIMADHYPGVRADVFDGDPQRGGTLLFQSDSGTIENVMVSSMRLRTLNVLDKRWTLRTTPLPAFARMQRTTEPWVFLGAGLLVSTLLTLTLWQLLVNQERRRSLEAATQLNRQLDAFCHTVAHDLQQPVAGVIGYSNLLLEDYAAGMAPKVKELVTNLAAVGERMDDLVQGLLALSTAVRAPIEREMVDVTAMAQQITSDLQAQHPQQRVQVVIADGLATHADPQLVRALLGNLIGNAWKYSSRAAAPRVEVGGVADDARIPFFVRDNGVGFSQEDAQHLFTAFRRLPTGQSFPGHGIGLATVQRIVERHEGEIWAEGKEGAGATFYFTLGRGETFYYPVGAPGSTGR
ncbi:MAG TPA: ATP-binding protein, partial [bacterium]